MPEEAQPDPRVLIISHRTQVGTCPENSWAGIEAALASGVDGIEMDVRCTRDGRLVLMHDRSLERTLGHPYHIDALDYADVQALVGRELAPPALDAVIERCAGRVILVLDVKQRGIADRIATLLRPWQGRLEAWAWSHEARIVHGLLHAMPRSVPVSLIVRPWFAPVFSDAMMMRTARARGMSGLLFERPYVNRPLIERAAAAGLALHCGRTNGADEVDRIRALGPASICTDYPELLPGLASRDEAVATARPSMGRDV